MIMKSLAKKLLQFSLRVVAKLTIKKYRPFVIGVTGSVGKTSTKKAIACLFEGESFRVASGNFNNEIGFPLAILGSWEKLERPLYKFYAKVIFSGIRNLLIRADYPGVLVLEYAADKPGDIKYLTSIAKPNVSVVTAVGEVPVHVEFYKSPEEVAKEKSQLIACLDEGDTAVLNVDDGAVGKMKNDTQANILTFGFADDAGIKIDNFSNSLKEELSASFEIKYKKESINLELGGVLGRQGAYAVAAATCVGIARGMELDSVAKLLQSYKPERGRMEVVRGANGVTVINDAYNASPLSMRAALEVLKDLQGRRVAVLGDMRELGEYTKDEHKKIGRLASECADSLVFVGEYAEFLTEGVEGVEDVLIFKTVEAMLEKIEGIVKEGDIVLVKGSRAVELEKVVEFLTLGHQ